MKKNTNRKIKLGLFVTAGIILFIGAIYYVGKQQNLFGSTFRIMGIFKNAGGLQVGNNVRFVGINVGTIENIEIISDTSVKVSIILEEEVRKFIKKDASAIIGSEGLMGDKIISINPGTFDAPIIKEKDTIPTIKPLDTDAILASLKATGENAAIITKELSEIIKKINNGQGSIGMLLMDNSFANNLSQSMINIKNGTNNFNQNMEALKHSILFRGYFKNKEKEKEEEGKNEKK